MDPVVARSRKVSFPVDSSQLVSEVHELHHESNAISRNWQTLELITNYLDECKKFDIQPLLEVEKVTKTATVKQSAERSLELCLSDVLLTWKQIEAMESVLSRLQFSRISLRNCFLDDHIIWNLTNMISFYQSCRHFEIDYVCKDSKQCANSEMTDDGINSVSSLLDNAKAFLVQLTLRKMPLLTNMSAMNHLSRALRSPTCSLRILHLEECMRSGSLLSLSLALRNNTSLRELHLPSNNLQSIDGLQLGILIRVNSHLDVLNVSHNALKDEGLNHISKALIENSCHAKSKKLVSTPLSPKRRYSDVSPHSCSKEFKFHEQDEQRVVYASDDQSVLDRQHQKPSSPTHAPLHDYVGRRARKILPSSGTDAASSSSCDTITTVESSVGLHTLIFRDNQVGAAAMIQLGQSLSSNDDHILRELDLSANPQLGNDAMEILRPALIVNQSLNTLRLADCALTDESAIMLSEYFAVSKNLTELDIRGNHFDYAGILAMSLSIRTNITLLHLHMDAPTSQGCNGVGGGGGGGFSSLKILSPRAKSIQNEFFQNKQDAFQRLMSKLTENQLLKELAIIQSQAIALQPARKTNETESVAHSDA